jgi:hypothetical protein
LVAHDAVYEYRLAVGIGMSIEIVCVQGRDAMCRMLDSQYVPHCCVHLDQPDKCRARSCRPEAKGMRGRGTTGEGDKCHAADERIEFCGDRHHVLFPYMHHCTWIVTTEKIPVSAMI